MVNGAGSRWRTTAPAILRGEPLLAVLAQHPGQLRGRVGVEDVGGGRAGGAVHPHVERRVLGVGEAALADVELHRGDAEVEEHRVDRVEAEVVEDVGQLVVDRVHAGEPVAEAGQPLAGQVEGRGVAVDADHPGQLAAGQHRLGVAAQAEGRVDHDRALVVEGRRQEGHDPVEEDGDVGGGGHRRQPCCPRWVITSSAVASATEVNAENAISAAASRAWSRTRRGAGGVSVAVRSASIDPSMTRASGKCVRWSGVERVERWGSQGQVSGRSACRLGPGKVSQKCAHPARGKPPGAGEGASGDEPGAERAETSPCDPLLSCACWWCGAGQSCGAPSSSRSANVSWAAAL